MKKYILYVKTNQSVGETILEKSIPLKTLREVVEKEYSKGFWSGDYFYMPSSIIYFRVAAETAE